jgi:CO dehydrogenase maturation factor
MRKKGNIVVVGGKGGVGKTSVSAILVKLLLGNGGKLLLIDADPVISVAYALGENPGATIGEFRESLIEDAGAQRNLQGRPMKTVIRELVTKSDKGYDLLAMGRAEGKGCFCGLNELLRFGIESLCGEYDTTLIDCEAGIEQVNRRAVHRIDKIILVTDTSRRGMESVVKIRDIATKYDDGGAMETYVLINRIRNEGEGLYTKSMAEELGLNVAGCVPEDPNILEYNAKGRSLVGLPDDSPSVAVLRNVLAGVGF